MKGNVFTGSLLVAGTSIGGGMLAMPVSTAAGGFIPSVVIFLACWLFMTATGLLMLEACLWSDGDTNMVSMADKHLGKVGKTVAWVMYLFLFYTLTLAYIVGCSQVFAFFFGTAIYTPFLVVLILGPLVYAGARIIGPLNIFLISGLAISYCIFVVTGWESVQNEFLLHKNWGESLAGLPVVFTAFGFQGLVPSLTRYLGRDRRKITTSILGGSLIALITYLIWQWLILGAVPFEVLAKSGSAVEPLSDVVQREIVADASEFFALFALVTSFLGVTLGLRDFLADGLRVEKNHRGRCLICALIFVPVLAVTYVYSDIFLTALEYAGGYGCAVLLGIMPVLMVWSGRYYQGLAGKRIVPGGRALLTLLLLFGLFEVLIETVSL